MPFVTDFSTSYNCLFNSSYCVDTISNKHILHLVCEDHSQLSRKKVSDLNEKIDFTWASYVEDHWLLIQWDVRCRERKGERFRWNVHIHVCLHFFTCTFIQLDQTTMYTPPLGSKLCPDCVKVCVCSIKQCPDALILFTAGGNESNGVVSELHAGVFH